MLPVTPVSRKQDQHDKLRLVSYQQLDFKSLLAPQDEQGTQSGCNPVCLAHWSTIPLRNNCQASVWQPVLPYAPTRKYTF
mmetsp:Transcript_19697/g.30865  ORF Transcript_19697/g.30865 Transcript_19697/m.30865 type:complete len:80 (-) Transcript_19697:7-246(-)